MSAQEEIEEHIHHARDLFEKLVAGNMAIAAALLAIVSVLGQHYNTEELLKQQESSDQWAYYQAKNIRLYIAQSTQDLMMAAGKADAPSSSRYQQDAARYKGEESGIQDKAHELERERDAHVVISIPVHCASQGVSLASMYALRMDQRHI